MKIPHRIEKDGVTRDVKPKQDQPCPIVICKSNKDNGCTKRMAMGTQTKGFATYFCPGLAKIKPDPNAHREIHLDHVQRKPKKILRGKQQELG